MKLCKHGESECGRFCKQCLEEYNNADDVERQAILSEFLEEKYKCEIETQDRMDIIKYRFVFNDALVHPWEPMPEAGQTLASLVEWLKGCVGHDMLGSPWDYRRLKGCCGWDSHVIDYGLRSQFYIPVVPKKSDFYWLQDDYHVKVKCTCGNTIELSEDYDAIGLCSDSGIRIYCDKCGSNNMGVDGRLPRSYDQAVSEWNLRFGNKKENK